MLSYALRRIVVEAESEHGIPPGHIRYNHWSPGQLLLDGADKLRIRPVMPRAGATLRDYLLEAMGAWTTDALVRYVADVMTAAVEKIGPWVDHRQSAVAAALRQDEQNEFLALVITDNECRNTARLRIDLGERAVVILGAKQREYHLAAVKLIGTPAQEAVNLFGLVGSDLTLYEVPDGMVLPVRPNVPEWSHPLEEYLRRIGVTEDVSKLVRAKAVEQVGGWVQEENSDVYAIMEADRAYEGHGSLALLIVNREHHKVAEMELVFGPGRAKSVT